MGTSQKDRLGVDPDAAFSELPTATQNAIVEYLIEEEGTTEITEEVEMIVGSSAADGATAASVGCAIQTKTAIHSQFGGVVWKYISSTQWCWDGTQITDDPLFYRDFWTVYPWEFVRHVSSNESGGQGDWVHRDYTKGHFRFCFQGDLGCPINNYPSLTKRQYGNGSTG